VSVFLSDLTASVDWALARQVLDYLDIPVPDEDDDLDQVLPAGGLSIFADLGIDEMDLGALSGHLDLVPYEALLIIARKLGFGHALERALDGALGPCPPGTWPRSSRPCGWLSARRRGGLRAVTTPTCPWARSCSTAAVR